MMMRIAIQCTDDRTGLKGTFAYRTGRDTLKGMRFYSLTPVFGSYIDLCDYMRDNKIGIDNSLVRHKQ